MSGGSRGIGEAIALRAARDGANIALLAKTTEPHPALPGTIHTAAAAIEEAGGRALPLVGDIRDDEFVLDAVAQTAETFGGIDVVVNNASAIDLSSTRDVSMKKYDLMNDINSRGSFLLAKSCIEHLAASDNAHVLTLSPPITLDPKWFKTATAYTIAKFGMSLVTLGLRGAARARHRRQLAVAAHRDRHRGGTQRRGARSPDALAQADDHGRRRVRDPHPPEPGVHRQLLHRRRRARGGRRHRLLDLPQRR
jgi:citronellol/citronellal dehydrogenase